MDFIPLVTNDQRIAFLQATQPLCPDVQRILWDMYLKTFEPEIPETPRKIKYVRRELKN
ncbi:hypothetical protein [Dishui Lake phycodnavirus 4]|jgi:hypothetical protein|nr:hypothetical protein [Dishui Lake phycodnavirus 4]